ncbi:MAG: hypothetical protein ACHQ4H_02050 [Ktedonobacterales bacterium]
MRDAYFGDADTNDATGRGRMRATPLLARLTPRLLESAEELLAAWGLCPDPPEWSGPLPVAPAVNQWHDMIQARVRSIAAAPEALLGWTDRQFLLYWARKGYPVYAYCSPRGEWNLWLDGWRIELPLPPHLSLSQDDVL